MSQIVVFDGVDLDLVLRALDQQGWVNLQPEVDEGVPSPSSSGVFAIFGARGPIVPFCTWHPGERSAGIQHGTGPKVSRRIEIPTGWRQVQDHPKRGIVVRVPAGVADEEVLRWLIATAAGLCPLPLLGRWVAELHDG